MMTRISYDYLVLALGGCTSYFGHPEWEQFAPDLKSLDDPCASVATFSSRLKKRRTPPTRWSMTGCAISNRRMAKTG